MEVMFAEWVDGARMASKVNFTSAALNGWPFENLTPWRSGIRQRLPSALIEGIAEAMRFAAAEGADLSRVLQAISAGFAGSRMLDLMGPKMVARDFAAGIQARLHAKDFGLAAEAAADAGLQLPALAAVHAQLQQLMALGLGQRDTSALLQVLEGD